MRYLSLFSGIEAASVAWKPLGWQCVGLSEIEPFPCALLRERFPGVPNLGDITRVTEEQIAALGRIDLIVFGSPCQDLSVAGKRKGLDGERSGLFFTAMRIVGWARKHCGLRWALWENVPGAFTSNQGADFAEVVGHLAGMAERPGVPPKGWGTEGCAVGDEAMVEWSTLDAQWFGVAQRRRRVFAVADFGDWSGRPPVLLEPQSLRGDSAPRREKGQGAAGTVARSVALRGREGGATAELGDDCGGTLRASGGGGDKPHVLVGSGLVRLAFGGGNQGGAIDVSTCLTHHGSRLDFDSETFVCATGDVTHTLKADGFDASEDGTGRGTPIIAFNSNAQPDEMRFDQHTAAALTCSQNSAIAFSCNDYVADATRELAPTMRAMGHSDSHANAGHQLAVAFDTYNQSATGDTTQTLCSRGDTPGGNAHLVPAVQIGMQVRRLTPRECERLQGFPDDHTAIPGAKDGPRYKALGNSMCTNVMRWIGQRIDFAHNFF